MSGLLDRMAKRALGTVEGVQPLVAPRYAPRSPEPRTAVFPLETTLEAEAPARETPRADSSAPRSSALPQQPPRPISEHIPTATSKRNQPEHAPQPVEGLLHSRPAEPIARPMEEPLPAHPRAVEPSRTILTRPVRVPQEPQLPATAPVPAAQIVPRDATIPDARSSLAEIAPSEESRPVRAVPRTSEENKLRQASQVTPSARPVEPIEQKAEIHITIGSIELRAPRPEAKAPRAPFRPRVTLDDFLHRRQEGRS